MIVVFIVFAVLAIFACIAGGIVLFRSITTEKALEDVVETKENHPPFSQTAMEVMIAKNASEMETMINKMENESMANFNKAVEALDNQMKSLGNTINSIEFDQWIDNKVNNIIVKDCKYFSLPSKENILFNNVFIKASGKVDISNQKVQVPAQKIEIPKQPEVPSVAKEPPKKIDLSRKVDLDVE